VGANARRCNSGWVAASVNMVGLRAFSIGQS